MERLCILYVYPRYPRGEASNDSGVVEDGNFHRFRWLFVRKFRQFSLREHGFLVQSSKRSSASERNASRTVTDVSVGLLHHCLVLCVAV